MATISGHPLPPNPFHQNLELERPLNEAYQRCFGMENCLDYIHKIHIRLLGYLMTELPKDGAHAVAEQVNLCDNDDELRELSEHYMFCLVGPLREDHDETCTSELSTPDSETLSGPPYLAPTDHRTARELALIRDSYRCLRTGHIDYKSSDNMTAETAQKYNISVDSAIFSSTSYFQILPSHIIWNVEINDNDDKKRRWLLSVSKIIKSLGFSDPEMLKEPMTHHLTNGLTFRVDIGKAFRDLRLWLEHLPNHPQPDTYIIRHIMKLIDYEKLPEGEPVTFTSTDPSLPLPGPKYLKFHATFSRVAWFSGAGRYLMWQEDMASELSLVDSNFAAQILARRLERVALTSR